MNADKIVAAFISGLVTSPVVNALFPIIFSVTFSNSESLPFLTKWLFRLVPLVLLLVLFVLVIDTIESFVAGVLGLIFSIVIFGGIGIVGVVTVAAIFFVIAFKISETQ